MTPATLTPSGTHGAGPMPTGSDLDEAMKAMTEAHDHLEALTWRLDRVMDVYNEGSGPPQEPINLETVGLLFSFVSGARMNIGELDELAVRFTDGIEALDAMRQDLEVKANA